MKSAVWNCRVHRLALAIILLMAMPAFSLYTIDSAQKISTKVKEPIERTISLKLPLLQPVFHWTFMSRADFLSGKLTLRIIRNGRSTDITIFENGRFTDGWGAMPLPPPPEKGEIYFGFVSTCKYLTAPEDKLELELTVVKDLPGIGPLQTGTLPAGKYKSRGTYSALIDEYDITSMAQELAREGKMTPAEQEELLDKMRQLYNYKAFLESWTDQWPLNITSEKGWLPDKAASVYKTNIEKMNVKAEPPVVSTDTAVANEKPSQKCLWYWLIIPIIALFVIITIRQVSTKQQSKKFENPKKLNS